MGDGKFKLPGRPAGRGDFASPLGAATSGRLVFVSRVADVRIKSDSGMKALARGHFVHDFPQVRIKDGTVIVQFPHFPFLDRRVDLRSPAARIDLNPSLPWEIEFRSDVSRITANLQDLQLRSLDMLGNASQIVLALSIPVGTAFIYIASDANQVRIVRPYGVGARIQLHKGATNLTLDGQHFHAIEGEAHLESKDFMNTTSRYDISICADANNMTVVPGSRS